ncbi:MAG: tRNA pseudouridine(13) synthase TruD, partial [bacterium]
DGIGEHLYIHLEKESRGTEDVAGHIAGTLGIARGRIGFAGKKDAQAVSRQWFSVQTERDPDLSPLNCRGIRLLSSGRHTNKLRRGHLWGNRFRIVVRGIDAHSDYAAILEIIARHGFPNFFGGQRLGFQMSNAISGRALVHREAPYRGPAEQLRFQVNAYQSFLFNRVTALRLSECFSTGLSTGPSTPGSWGRMMEGDLAVLHRNGASFPAGHEELETLQVRAGQGEISPSAPLFGYRVPLAEGLPGQWERKILAEEGLSLEAFRLGGKRRSPKGERRPVREFAHGLRWERWNDGETPCLTLGFELRRGVYATSLAREIMKNEGRCSFPAP